MHDLSPLELLRGLWGRVGPGGRVSPRSLLGDYVDVGALLEGRTAIRDLHRRNHVVHVEPIDTAGVVFKQGGGVAAEISSLQRLRGFSGLDVITPVVEFEDRASALLVLRSEPGTVHLWDYHEREGQFPDWVGAATGALLGRFHLETTDGAADPLSQGPPSASAIHRPLVDDLRDLSPGSMELIREVQNHPRLPDRLDEIGTLWRPTCLVHDDVKWANIIVVPVVSEAGGSLRLIDWEHLRRGDPAWDVGSALASYLAYWIVSIPTGSGDGDLMSRASAARAPVELMQPAMAALWLAYLDQARVRPMDEPDLMTRVAALCAVRLLRNAFEETATREFLTFRAALSLQVAANMLDDPLAAAEVLLGLPRRAA